jgi:hypothetical protein
VAIAAPLLGSGCGNNQCTVAERSVGVPLPDVYQTEIVSADVDAGTCTPALSWGCLGEPDSCRIEPADGGWVAQLHFPGFTYPCDHPCRGGRRPEGFVADESEGSAAALARHFARMGQVEAASVIAFDRLAGELRQFGAPRSLQRAAALAKRDEIRHARIFSTLAARHGASVPRVAASPARSRTRFEIAVENVIEGCVRESFGAAEARFASLRAESPSLRKAMAGIARDEERHAALAWAVDEWARTRLSTVEQRHLEEARERAIAELGSEIAGEPPTEVMRVAGVPTAPQARALLGMARATLWS